MTTLTQKSQVTIPKSIREMLGLKPGDDVEFTLEKGSILLNKKCKKLPFDKWKGYLKGVDTKKIMEELRG